MTVVFLDSVPNVSLPRFVANITIRENIVFFCLVA